MPAADAQPPRSAGIPVKFFLVTFAWSWLCFVPSTLVERGAIGLPLPAGLLRTLGGFGPLIAALLLTYQADGMAGLRALAGRIVRWRTPIIWYIVAFLGPFALQLAAMGLHVLFGSQPPHLGLLLEEVPNILVNFIFSLLLIGIPEETGWRGYALPRLQSRYSALVASLILGLVWAVWHLPLFFNPAVAYGSTPFTVYVPFMLAFTIVLTWVYNSTRGSVLLVAILHAMVNVTSRLWMAVPDVGPMAQTSPGTVGYLYWLLTAVLWATVLIVTLIAGWRNLSRQPRQVVGATAPG